MSATLEWKPAVGLPLETASTTAFQEIVGQFYAWSRNQPPPGRTPLVNGWHEITPQIAEHLLRCNTVNRSVSLSVVKKYCAAMATNQWRRTGQTISVNLDGKTEDGQHRLWAGYLGKVSFTSYVVTDVAVEADLFAFIDDGKSRTAGDALHISGMNGLSPVLSQAIKLAWRYQTNKLFSLGKAPRIIEMTTPQILEYGRRNPSLQPAAHLPWATITRPSPSSTIRPWPSSSLGKC